MLEGKDMQRDQIEPLSITHQHLSAILSSESRNSNVHQINVLDAGCGDGELLSFLQRSLNTEPDNATWSLHGFDVHDSTSNRDNFPEATCNYLATSTDVDNWAERVKVASISDPWPFASDSFDFVVSNQVLEHVHHLESFLAELSRVLRPGGRSFHLFPLKNCLLEGHVRVPLSAQVSGLEQRQALTAAAYRLGFGKAKHRARGSRGVSHASEYVHLGTHYRSWRHFVIASKRAALVPSYRYTPEFYAQKFRQVLRRPLKTDYPTQRNALLDACSFSLLRYVSSITLVLERPAQNQATSGH